MYWMAYGMAERKAKLTRQTKETQVDVEINLDGIGESSIDTPNGMFNHLLEQLARHGLLDISVSAKGDLSPGWHHLVEDVAIVLVEGAATVIAGTVR